MQWLLNRWLVYEAPCCVIGVRGTCCVLAICFVRVHSWLWGALARRAAQDKHCVHYNNLRVSPIEVPGWSPSFPDLVCLDVVIGMHKLFSCLLLVCHWRKFTVSSTIVCSASLTLSLFSQSNGFAFSFLLVHSHKETTPSWLWLLYQYSVCVYSTSHTYISLAPPIHLSKSKQGGIFAYLLLFMVLNLSAGSP